MKTLTDEQREQRVAAIRARWGERGKSKQIRVDADAADALLAVPERDRRRVASDGVRGAVKDYKAKKQGMSKIDPDKKQGMKFA